MRIAILTQWYPPEPAFLIQELAQTLKMKGHVVTVLTGFPNYPSGRIYSGYRLRLVQREVLEGVPVVRVALYPEHSLSGIRRAANYFSFALSCALLGFWVVPKPDVVFVYHPPLTVGLPAFVLSRLWGVPFIYQIQDMWPETLKATGMLMNPNLLTWIGRFANWVYARANRILVISPGFKKNLLQKGVPEEKIRVISNWVDLSVYENVIPMPELVEKLGLAGQFNIMYAGNMGEAQGLENVLEAATLLSDVPEVKFVFVGDGTALPGLRQMAVNRNLDNVRFLGRYPYHDMPHLYALAEVLLVHLEADPLFYITIPSKTLAYLASGKPIIAAAKGDVADLIVSAGAGIVCPPGNPKALADCVRHLYQMSIDERRAFGERGRQAASGQFCRNALITEIEKELQKAASLRY